MYRRIPAGVAALVLIVASTALIAAPAGAVDVTTESELQTNFSDGNVTEITLLNSIDLTCIGGGDLDRDSANPITINGNGFTIRQTCAGERVMELVDADGQGAGALTVDHTTITGGNLDGQGAGIKYGNPGTGGPITVRSSSFIGNNAGTSAGGAILQVGDVPGAVIDSTFTGNSASGGSALAEIDLIVNSTITGNTSTTFSGAVVSDSDVTTVYSTIVGNTTTAGQPANIDAASFASFGTVIGDPIGTTINCDNTTNASSGFNFEAGGDTCGFSAATNDVVNGADPLLGALAANGGPTQTRLPQAGSPLLDAIPVASCSGGDGLAGSAVTADQRGVSRPQGSGCDVGAVEVTVEIAVTPRFTG